MIGFPLLIIPFAIYHMVVFLLDVKDPVKWWGTELYFMPVALKSGDAWTGTLSDAFLAFSLLMLMFEFIKSARHGKSLVEHFLSLLLAGGTAAEFWMLPRFRKLDLPAVRGDLLRRSVRGPRGFAAPRAARRGRRATGSGRACTGRAGSGGACPGRSGPSVPHGTHAPGRAGHHRARAKVRDVG